MTPTRDKINEMLAEIERLEPVAVQEEQDDATRLALEAERHSAQVRLSLAQARGKRPMSDDYFAPLGPTGVEQAALEQATLAQIDQAIEHARTGG